MAQKVGVGPGAMTFFLFVVRTTSKSVILPNIAVRIAVALQHDTEHCCHWEKPCCPPSLGPRVEPPRTVESGWERNALGCGAAPTLEDRRHNSHTMETNDPYLHLSKYSAGLSSPPAARRGPRSEACACCFDRSGARFTAFVCSRASRAP